jgi:hypothetical protein
MLVYAVQPPVHVAAAALAAGPSKAGVALTSFSPDAWMRFSMPASATIDVWALHAGRPVVHFPRSAPQCQVAASRRICTFRLLGDSRGRWQVSLHKRSAPPATVRVMLIERRVDVPPPR